MIGYPKVLNTKSDFEHAVEYALEHENYKPVIKRELEGIKANVYMKVLKKEAEGKNPEEITPEDYEDVLNPACPKNKLGFADEEIDKLIKRVSK